MPLMNRIALLLSAVFTYLVCLPAMAEPSIWEWTWVQVGPGSHSVFQGTATMEEGRGEFKALLKEASNTLAIFPVRGSTQKTKVRIIVTPPNSDSGDFLLPEGRRSIYRLDPYSRQEVIWATDPVTGDYLALSRTIK